MWGIAELIGQVPLPEGLDAALLSVDLGGAVHDATVLGLTWPPYHLRFKGSLYSKYFIHFH